MIFTIIFRNYNDMIGKYNHLAIKDRFIINTFSTVGYLFLLMIILDKTTQYIGHTEYFKNLGLFSYSKPLIIDGKILPITELGTLHNIKPLTYFIIFLKFLFAHKVAMWITAFASNIVINENYNDVLKEENNAREQHNQYLTTKRETEEGERYRKQLKEIEDREYAKTKGQSRALMSLYEGQLKLLQDHKRQGMDIEKKSFELRKKLLELESEENEKMINDLLKTLDRINK